MRPVHYSVKRVSDLYGLPSAQAKLKKLAQEGKIPPTRKFRSGAVFNQGWLFEELPQLGEHIGFFPKFDRAVSIAVFTTKGGVLKSTMALNLARVAALHNLKTLVIGLDIQGDITTALGHDLSGEDDGDIDTLIGNLNQVKGLPDFFNEHNRLNDLIVNTDIPNLFLIPETPELVALNESLSTINRREYWLREKVVQPLKRYFDLIVMDCSPNWNKLTTNAIVASDVLVSPLECKINNFRNFKVFAHFLQEFRRQMRIQFESVFVPTKFNTNRKLSLDIKSWYQSHVKGCAVQGIRESTVSEEATAMHLSVVEHAPAHRSAAEMRALLQEIHGRVSNYLENPRANSIYAGLRNSPLIDATL